MPGGNTWPKEACDMCARTGRSAARVTPFVFTLACVLSCCWLPAVVLHRDLGCVDWRGARQLAQTQKSSGPGDVRRRSSESCRRCECLLRLCCRCGCSVASLLTFEAPCSDQHLQPLAHEPSQPLGASCAGPARAYSTHLWRSPVQSASVASVSCMPRVSTAELAEGQSV